MHGKLQYGGKYILKSEKNDADVLVKLFVLFQPYFGGAAQCEGAVWDHDVKAEELICPACVGPEQVQVRHVSLIELKTEFNVPL